MKRGENSPFFLPSPILPVQIPIADGFGQVSGEYLFTAFQIVNGKRDHYAGDIEVAKKYL